VPSSTISRLNSGECSSQSPGRRVSPFTRCPLYAEPRPISGFNSIPRCSAVFALSSPGAMNQAIATPTTYTNSVARIACQVKMVSLSGITPLA
jgi:hypothetical protein